MPHVVRVALIPQLLPVDCFSAAQATIVIDTLRFTTTACQALVAGATSVTVAPDIETAHQVAMRPSTTNPNASVKSRPLLCGERHCRPIEGFDLGNSPYEYTPEVVSGQELVFTTTNGTRAVSAARRSPTILLAGLVNRTAAARALHHACLVADIAENWIVCSGTDGEVATEDVLAAGAILAALLQDDRSLVLGNDAAWIALALWQQCQHSTTAPTVEQGARPSTINRLFQQFRGGQNLVENGYARDLEFASQVDAFTVVPISSFNSFDRFTRE